MIKITGTLIKNYLHCRREAYLYYYGINFRNDLVRIGEILHEEAHAKEFVFENLKVDDIHNQTIIEFKKTLSNEEGARFQLLWYLKYFKDHGVNMTGKLINLTTKDKKEIKLTDENEKSLNNLIEEIKTTLKGPVPKRKNKKKECRGCSFFNYCWVE